MAQTSRAQRHTVTRSVILDAARRVAERDGAREFSLRGVAAEADFAPAALYGYFRGKDDLLLALAADDLSALARAMRDSAKDAPNRLAAAAGAALEHLQKAETIAAVSSALSVQSGATEAERLFNGRLIGVLKTLSEARGVPLDSRPAQIDVVLLAATLTGLAAFARCGRLQTLGFHSGELVDALAQKFGRPE